MRKDKYGVSRTLLSTCRVFELDGSKKKSSYRNHLEKIFDIFSFLWNKELGSGMIEASKLWLL